MTKIDAKRTKIEKLKKYKTKIGHNQSYMRVYDIISYFSLVIKLFIARIVVQGRNADALALYFGEDPAKVPLEQGKTN